mmetsp:Transcript_51291/g.154136  ORF Transcript_51291/g.154136 Transcript_51291/m.154136 type:complete len:81 (-) Transcript_51291:689-931(-)
MKERTNCVNFQKALKYVDLNKDTISDKNLMKWAYNVAVTRSIEVNGERVIAPMADMVRASRKVYFLTSHFSCSDKRYSRT